jgi:hypothetical protein
MNDDVFSALAYGLTMTKFKVDSLINVLNTINPDKNRQLRPLVIWYRNTPNAAYILTTFTPQIKSWLSLS